MPRLKKKNYAAIATVAFISFNMTKGLVPAIRSDITAFAQKVFEKSDITNSDAQQSNIGKAIHEMKTTMAPYDTATAPENELNVNVPRDTHGVGKTGSIDVKASSPTDRSAWMTEADISELEKRAEEDSKQLMAAAIERGYGNIAFEDGENDDHLASFVRYVTSGVIPEIIVIHGGNAQVRYESYCAFWKAISEATGCKIPKMLLGADRNAEKQLFDDVEGIASIDPERRKVMVDKPMPNEERMKKAQETYKIVKDYIDELDGVAVALKTVPTDLVKILDSMEESSKKKMVIFWATPGAFSTNKETHELEMHAKFNFYTDDEASIKLLESGMKIFMTGGGISNSRVEGIVDENYVPELAKVAKGYKEFKGFEGFTKLLEEVQEGDFFYYYRAQQLEFQKLKYQDAENKFEVEYPMRQNVLKDLKGPRQIEQFIEESKDESDGWKKNLSTLLAGKSYEENQRTLALELQKLEDWKNRETHLYSRWNPVIDKPNFMEGCSADLLLGFLLDPALRKSSVKEIISVKLRRDTKRDTLIEIKADKHSNCFILTGVDSSKMNQQIQDLITGINEKQIQMPWKTSNNRPERPETTAGEPGSKHATSEHHPRETSTSKDL